MELRNQKIKKKKKILSTSQLGYKLFVNKYVII